MGLDLTTGRARNYLRDWYVDSDNPVATSSLALQRISEEILRQGGAHSPALDSPIGQRIDYHFGSYAAIHLLRLYAARTSGYELSQAYASPVTYLSVKTNKVVRTSEKPGPIFMKGELEREFGANLNSLAPRNKMKVSPFPYPQLVLFSDADGIYLPARFPFTFIMDDLYIGSLPILIRELISIRRSVSTRLNIRRSGPVAKFLSTVDCQAKVLQKISSSALKNRTSLIFT